MSVTSNTTVTYNSYALSDVATFIPRVTDHQSAPEREMNMLKVARNDGSKLISSWWKEKYITLEGFIQASSQATLEAKIDEFKTYLSIPSATLSYSWDASGNREYHDATISNLKIIRDSDNRDWCEFSITFLVPSGKGQATSATTVSYPNVTTATKAITLTVTGSAIAHPIFTFTVNSETSLTNIALTNTSTFLGTNNTINFPASYNAADVLSVDFGTFEVTLNGSPLDYTGAWPSFGPQGNSISIVFSSAAHNVTIGISYYPEYL